jgi:Ca2+-binding EF-hand superfamily protein
MKHSLKILGLAIASTAVATPAFSADKQTEKKTHTVTEVVGYVETVDYPDSINKTFAKLDKDHNGAISFNEYRNGSMVNEPYRVFLALDSNGDKDVSIQELNDFSKTKGGSQSASRFNFNQPKKTDFN